MIHDFAAFYKLAFEVATSCAGLAVCHAWSLGVMGTIDGEGLLARCSPLAFLDSTNGKERCHGTKRNRH